MANIEQRAQVDIDVNHHLAPGRAHKKAAPGGTRLFRSKGTGFDCLRIIGAYATLVGC